MYFPANGSPLHNFSTYFVGTGHPKVSEVVTIV